MPLTTTAIHWNTPFPNAVLTHLLRIGGPLLDFSDTLLVVPGARAGRRITALLVDEAARRRVPMIPPQVSTAGSLPSELLALPARPAGELARQIAWAQALMHMDDSSRAILFPRPPASGDFPGFLRISGLLMKCQQELAGARLTFADVAAKAEKLGTFGDPLRWQAAAALESDYLARLAAAGLMDEQHARNALIAQGTLRPVRQIIMAGVAEMNLQTRALLQAASARSDITILLYAPPVLADRFDSLGCVLPEAWLTAPLGLDRAVVRIAEDPDSVAQAVFRAIGELPVPPRADQLTIGVLDDSLVSFIEAQADEIGDIPVRYGPGRGLGQSRPCRFLSAVAYFFETRRFADFLALVRNVDVRRYVSVCWKARADLEAARFEPDWLGLLDDYGARFLPDCLSAEQLLPTGWRGFAGGQPGFSASDLSWLYGELCLLIGLRQAAAVDPLPAHAPRILETLRRAFGALELSSQKIADLAIRGALESLAHALAQIANQTGWSEPPVVSHAGAVRIALSLVEGERVVPPYGGDEIDMVGWLELMPDDAERLIVAGFNEGRVPEASRPDPFLNDSVRRLLGLADDERRDARDAYLLAAMLGSRAGGSVTLIAGRFTAGHDPLLPSRLLFADGGAVMLGNVKSFVNPAAAGTRLVPRRGHAAVSLFGGLPVPDAARLRIPEEMTVSQFRSYLESPLGFYLQHMHNGGLRPVAEEAPRELLVQGFGNFVHEVVREAMEGGGGLDSRGAWEDRLLEVLHRRVGREFGTEPGAVLRFQVALLEQRLAGFAQWQHEWQRAGWRTMYAERRAAAALAVDGVPMRLRGRIDRIDLHESSGAVALLDYKVCAGDKTPERTHRKQGRWIDLQLPLYRLLAGELIAGKEVKLGYVRIADDPKYLNAALAEWTAEDLASAEETAREVVRKIRRGEFSDPGENPPTDGAFGYLVGQGLLNVESDADEEGAG